MAKSAAQRYREAQLANQRRHDTGLGRERNITSTLAAGGNPFKPFTPYQPHVPGGLYDPALDYQKDAAGRGYLDKQQDIGLAGTRALEDYTTGGRQLDFAEKQYDETYGRNVELLTRKYTNLARSQAEGARRYGVTSGGLALLSAAKRTANQGVEQAGLDLARNQFRAGIEDPNVGSRALLKTGYERGVTDRATDLSRAGRENTFFGRGIENQKIYQASQGPNPWTPPLPGTPGGRPLNERTTAGGQVVRTETHGGIVYIYDQTGKIISRRPVRGFVPPKGRR